ncbi:DUF6918 family protein [Arsenicicoccus dermatophilus]|uniref:DUF6918 family protein n=1 Tax=Arsenicicoccus dermatophilus TaxID=1076331 RepID=UPI0039171C5F
MTTSLPETLLDPARRDTAVDTLTGVVDAEIADKKGVSGTVLKTAYSAVKKINDGIVRKAVDAMLPDAAAAMQPLWETRGTTPFGEHLAANSSQAADALLAVSDKRAANPKHAAIAKIYNGVRPKAKEHVVAALPRVGSAVETLAS